MSTQRNTLIAKAVRFALIGGAAVSAVTPAFAADEAEGQKAERIEVTGSRIKRTDIEGANPVLVLDRQAIEATGLASVGDILQDLPAAGSAINTTFNNGGDGSTEVDLRNLGSQRVLVLINGRRWNPGISGSVDLNNIPAAIIERIEVLKDGASAIYGSDAIAGVVNIFTRKDYEGAYGNAYFGENEEGDGRVELYDFGVGMTGDKGSAFLGMSYLQQGSIFAGDREVSAVPVFGAPTNFNGSAGTPQGRFLQITPTNSVLDQTLDANGNLTPWVEPTSRYNFAPENYLQTPSERTNVYAQANYEINDSIEFRTEFFYGNRKSAQLLAPTPLFIGYYGSGLGTVSYIAADNPYNPFGYALDSQGNDPAAGFLLLSGRRMLEAGPRLFQQDVDQYQWNAGFQGSFEIGNRIFDWDVNNIYGFIQQNDITDGLLNMQRVNRALLGPSDCDSSLPRSDVNYCVPLNLFGGQGPNGAGTITPDMIDYITFTAQDAAESTIRSHSANISTELFELPGGMVGFAAGFETRRYSAYDQPDALIAAGITSGNARQPTSGAYSLDEYYVELAIPLLSDMAGAELLELGVAARTSDYSNFGETTNAKYGLKWKPVDELLVRATYAEGFRAPSITELFLGAGDSFPELQDPCNGGAAANPDKPGCAGVPTGYNQPNSQIRITVGGNENLEPEESVSKTFGFVWNPEFVEGLDITVDYYDIEVTNNIGTLGGQTILNACANSLQFCNLITRTGAGNVADLVNRRINTGEVQVTGYDLGVAYRLADTGFGSFKVVFDASFAEEYLTRDFDPDSNALVETDFIGRAGDRVVIPEIRSNLNLYWTMGDFEAIWRMRYLSETTENCELGQGTSTSSGTTQTPRSAAWSRHANAVEISLCSDLDPNTGAALAAANDTSVSNLALRQMFNDLDHENRLDAALYHDISVSYSIADFNAKVTVGGVNVLNEEPAVSYSTFANSFDPTMYDVPGAFWYVRYSQNF